MVVVIFSFEFCNWKLLKISPEKKRESEKKAEAKFKYDTNQPTSLYIYVIETLVLKIDPYKSSFYLNTYSLFSRACFSY